MRKTLRVAALLAAALSVPPALACGLEGVINNPFTVSYPGSLGIVISTRHAIVTGQIAAPPELSESASKMPHERITEQLTLLRERLEKTGLASGFSVLVVEVGHWAQFSVGDGRVQFASANAPPEQGGAILLTSESALAAMLEGKLSADNAAQQGLLRWQGQENPATRQAFTQALAQTS